VVLSFTNPFKFGSSAVPTSSGMKSFVLEQDKIEFLYPDNWIADLTPQGEHGDREVIAFLTAPAPLFENIVVARKEFDGEDVSAVANWGESKAQSRFIRYKMNILIPYSSEQVSGLIREYVDDTGSSLMTKNSYCKDLYFLHQHQGYTFSFCTYESDWDKVSPTFDKIIESIRFLE
jgi:hypothetical protein